MSRRERREGCEVDETEDEIVLETIQGPRISADHFVDLQVSSNIRTI